MYILNSFEDIPKNLKTPISLTIGSYDGIHLGHRAVFAKMKTLSATTFVLTFENHPSQILNPENPAPPIDPIETKLELLKECGIKYVLLLPFTKETTSYTYDEYLDMVRNYLPFDFLVLGEDARLGKGRTGTPDKIQAYAKTHGFEAVYVHELKEGGKKISSGRIRKLLSEGKIEEAKKLLGR